jgi:hypothetical protein
VLTILFSRLRCNLLNVQLEGRHGNPLQVKFLKELLVNLSWVDLVNGHWEFEAIIKSQLEFPPLFDDLLFLLFDFPLILDDLGGLCHLVEGIVVAGIEEENAGLF